VLSSLRRARHSYDHLLPNSANRLENMRINLQCAYKDKDKVKALGARWDVANRVWYIIDVEDLTPFMRWIPPSDADKRPVEELITLEDFLKRSYTKHISLTIRSAKAFGIPYPLESGWAQKYAKKTALVKRLSVGKKAKS